MLAWLSVWNQVQVISIWSATLSSLVKMQNGLRFWCQLTQVVWETRPLNEYVDQRNTVWDRLDI